MTTIIDIAQKAGVSKSTVSRVLSESGSYSSQAKRKVMSAVKEMNYTTNGVARAMVLKKTNLIGVVIYKKHMPIISHPFYGPVLDAITTEAKKAEYGIIMMTDEEATTESGNQLVHHRVDGMILMSRIPEHVIEYYKGLGVPFILVNNTEVVKGCHYIVNDDYLAAYDAGMYLLNKGYENVGIVSGPLEHRSYRLRFRGFQDALARKDVEIKPEHRWVGDSVIDTGMEAAYHMLRQPNRPDCLFCSNDMMAIGAMQIAHSFNLSIPKDLGIMGFDDIAFSRLTYPPLTTMKVEKKRMGETAIQQLLSLIDQGNRHHRKTILPAQVMERQST